MLVYQSEIKVSLSYIHKDKKDYKRAISKYDGLSISVVDWTRTMSDEELERHTRSIIRRKIKSIFKMLEKRKNEDLKNKRPSVG